MAKNSESDTVLQPACSTTGIFLFSDEENEISTLNTQGGEISRGKTGSDPWIFFLPSLSFVR